MMAVVPDITGFLEEISADLLNVGVGLINDTWSFVAQAGMTGYLFGADLWSNLTTARQTATEIGVKPLAKKFVVVKVLQERKLMKQKKPTVTKVTMASTEKQTSASMENQLQVLATANLDTIKVTDTALVDQAVASIDNEIKGGLTPPQGGN